MAEALLRFRESGHVTTETRYLANTVVTVQEDGWQWGAIELASDAELQALAATVPGAWPRQFFVVKMPGVAADDVLDFVDEKYTNTALPPGQGKREMPAPGGGLEKRRVWQFRRGNLPGPVQQEISDFGFITLTEAQVRSLMDAI